MSLLGRYQINQPKPKSNSGSRRAQHNQNQIETLEVRDLMAADLSIELIQDSAETEDRHLSPIWFEQFSESSQEQISLGGATLAETTARVQWNDTTLAVYQDEWIVQLDTNFAAQIQSLSEVTQYLNPTAMQFEIISGLGLSGQVLLRTFDTSMEEVSQWLSENTLIETYEPNALLPNHFVPNDTEFESMWGLNNTGQTGGTADADIDATEAWQITTGSPEYVVAVIDTGIDYSHPDLVSSIWTNPGEIAGNGIDDDNNGFVDDVHGYDFINNDGDPMDDNSHGTHVAGTIAAEGNNSQGVIGVAPEASVMGLKFLGANGSGSTSDAIRALNYATMMKSIYGINVVATNNSWGGGDYSQALYNAIKASGDEDILFVAAAGNMGTNNDVSPQYPAGYGLDNVISVAATDHRDRLASFSNYGANTVDLATPGVDILSTIPGGGYASFSGTSMATPHVSGVVALAYATNSTLTMEQVKDAILNGVDEIDALGNKVSTSGRLNAASTLQQLSLVVSEASVSAGEVVRDTLSDFTLTFSANVDPASIRAQDFRVNGIAANRFTVIDINKVQYHFDETPMLTEGEQTFELAEGALSRTGDGLSSSSWNSTFIYDAVELDVVATNIANGEQLNHLPEFLEFKFNEAVDPVSLGTDDLNLSVGSVARVDVIDSRTVRYFLDLPKDDQLVEYQFNAAAVTDIAGSPGNSFAGNFHIDLVEIVKFEKTGPITLPTYGMMDIPLEITKDFQIADVDVLLDVSHNWVSDLSFSLVAPDGTIVQLFSGIGGNADDFSGTVLDDEASQTIQSAAAPFRGNFRPLISLSTFDSKSTLGTWKLRVSDNFVSDVGTLNSFALKFEVVSPLTFTPLADVELSGTSESVTVQLKASGGNESKIRYEAKAIPSQGQAEVPVQISINQQTDQLTFKVSDSFSGSFDILVTVNDGETELQERFTVTVTNTPVELGEIEDQTLTDWQQTLQLELPVSNVDGDPLQFEVSATAEQQGDELAELDQQLNLVSDDYLLRSNYAYNTQGQGEKYLRAANYQYYYLLSDGNQASLYQWTGSFSNSPLIAVLDKAVYDDPSLLHDAEYKALEVDATIQDGVLILNAPEAYVGKIEVSISVSDGNSQDTKTFVVNVLEEKIVDPEPEPVEDPAPPALLESIEDQTIARGDNSFVLELFDYQFASDATRFEASVFSPEALVDQEFGLYADSWIVNANYGYNAQGQGEKYLRGENYSWYYLVLNDGQTELYQWTGSFEGNELLATLDSQVYESPALLHDAGSLDLSGVDLQVDDSGILTINTDSQYVGTFEVEVVAYAEGEQRTERFFVTIENQEVSLKEIEDQAIESGQEFIYQLETEGVDNSQLEFSVTAFAVSNMEAFELDQQMGFIEDAFLVKANYGYNAYGLGEKYIRTENSQWFYIVDNGTHAELYVWDGTFDQGEAIATLDQSIYHDPKILLNAEESASVLSPTVINGQLYLETGENFEGQIVVNVSVSDGVTEASQEFTLEVNEPEQIDSLSSSHISSNILDQISSISKSLDSALVDDNIQQSKPSTSSLGGSIANQWDSMLAELATDLANPDQAFDNQVMDEVDDWVQSVSDLLNADQADLFDQSAD